MPSIDQQIQKLLGQLQDVSVSHHQWVQLAYLYEANGAIDEAVSILETVARHHEDQDDWLKAMAYYRMILDRRPDHAGATERLDALDQQLLEPACYGCCRREQPLWRGPLSRGSLCAECVVNVARAMTFPLPQTELREGDPKSPEELLAELLERQRAATDLVDVYRALVVALSGARPPSSEVPSRPQLCNGCGIDIARAPFAVSLEYGHVCTTCVRHACVQRAHGSVAGELEATFVALAELETQLRKSEAHLGIHRLKRESDLSMAAQSLGLTVPLGTRGPRPACFPHDYYIFWVHDLVAFDALAQTGSGSVSMIDRSTADFAASVVFDVGDHWRVVFAAPTGRVLS